MVRSLALVAVLLSAGVGRPADPHSPERHAGDDARAGGADAELRALLDDIAAVLKKHDQTAVRLGACAPDGGASPHVAPEMRRVLGAGLRAKGVTVDPDALLELRAEYAPAADAPTCVRVAAKLVNTKTRLEVAGVSIVLAESLFRWPGEDEFQKGLASARGLGVKIHVPDAVQSFRRASAKGHPVAAAHLAMWLVEGGAGAFDPADGERLARRALPDLRTAAEFDHAEARYALGCLLASGTGVGQDLAAAFKSFRRAADLGHAPAMTRVGIAYLHGLGIEADATEARTWFGKSADANDAGGIFATGRLHEFGTGVPQDHAEALKWYRKGADRHDPAAFNSLGWFYGNGLGVEKDYREAMKWYRKAADQNHPAAQNSVGYFFAEGLGVEKDPVEAMKWYRKAADQNHAAALNNIGVLYATGAGVGKNPAEAVTWFRKAAKLGNPEAKAWLKELGERDD